jgi:hypothetical protein
MRYGLVVAAVLATMRLAHAQNALILDEIVGSWQGDDEIQFIELRMLADGQNQLANRAAIILDGASGSEAGRRVLFFQQDVARGVEGAKVLIATQKARDLADVQPDFLMPIGFLRPEAGRVCYAVQGALGLVPIDCVGYGAYTGDNAPYGPPTQITPDNRALRRIQRTGRNRTDWDGILDPVLQNNAGGSGTLPPTLCGDDVISQGEECDGTALAGETCATLGFAKGKLRCIQCHFDTKQCTSCGNDAINGKEECDGGDLGERTCESLGHTGGTLACTEDCAITTAGCEPSFFLPGGGPPKSDCLGEWLLSKASGGPNAKGKVAARQTCTDGDAGCDADGAADGTCRFRVAACLARADPRLACAPPAISAWALLGKLDPASSPAGALLDSVAALGPSTVAGLAVNFSPLLAEAGCAETVTVPVAAGKRLALRARVAGPDGKPKDTDTVRLICGR